MSCYMEQVKNLCRNPKYCTKWIYTFNQEFIESAAGLSAFVSVRCFVFVIFAVCFFGLTTCTDFVFRVYAFYSEALQPRDGSPIGNILIERSVVLTEQSRKFKIFLWVHAPRPP